MRSSDPKDLHGYTVRISGRSTPSTNAPKPTVTGADGTSFRVSKGAPQVILALAANAAAIEPPLDRAVDEFAARGYRSLGVARADGDGRGSSWEYSRYFDPPREDAQSTIATAAVMGVAVKMVTGDALAIAKETAAKVGLGTDILDAAGLGDVKKQEPRRPHGPSRPPTGSRKSSPSTSTTSSMSCRCVATSSG